MCSWPLEQICGKYSNNRRAKNEIRRTKILYMTEPMIQEIEGGVVFAVKIVPGASKTSVCGLLDSALKIRVSAAPQRGKANRCLLEFLAEQLGVKKNAISIISGKTSPVKRVQVLGMSAEMLLKKLKIEKKCT